MEGVASYNYKKTQLEEGNAWVSNCLVHWGLKKEVLISGNSTNTKIVEHRKSFAPDSYMMEKLKELYPGTSQELLSDISRILCVRDPRTAVHGFLNEPALLLAG